jgi:type I restriction enzyme S subunit
MEALQDTYKDTKIGRIPNEWELKKLEEIASFRRGSFPQPYGLEKWYDDENGHPFIQVYDVGKQMKLKPTTKRKISDAAAEKSVFVAKGTLILTIQGSIGRVAITQYDAYIDRTLLIFQSFLLPTDKIFLSSQLEVLFNKERQKANGSTILTITKAQLSKFLIPLPPLAEQQKIAAILSTVDEQISTTDKIIEKSKELKKGLMQKLFSEGIGHTEFKDTKIGRIPKDWEILKINKVADCYGGTTPSTIVKEYWSGDILWATPSDITKNKSEYLLDTNRKITEQGRASKNLRFVKKNGLLMTSRASIGFLNISNGDVVTNQGFINIECKDNFHYKFFYYWVLDNRKKLLSLSQGSTFLELNRKTFAKINIPIPPLPEQQKIATILSEADAKIEKEQIQKAQLQALKKGLMQQLLTGKKRVNV